MINKKTIKTEKNKSSGDIPKIMASALLAVTFLAILPIFSYARSEDFMQAIFIFALGLLFYALVYFLLAINVRFFGKIINWSNNHWFGFVFIFNPDFWAKDPDAVFLLPWQDKYLDKNHPSYSLKKAGMALALNFFLIALLLLGVYWLALSNK